jgi:hypothetical protein
MRRARVIVSNWQIWSLAAIAAASSRSCSFQTAPATRPNHKPNTGPGVSTRGRWTALDTRQHSVASLLRDRL